MASGGVAPTLNAFDNTTESRATIIVFYPRVFEGVRIQTKGVINTLPNKMGTGGGNTPVVAHLPIPIHDQATRFGGKRGDKQDGKGNGLGIGNPGDPMNTLTQGDRHAAMTEATVRRLTPLECERLQGFPDNWTAEKFDERKATVVTQADSARYKQMGNAVAVPVFQWVLARLVEIERQT